MQFAITEELATSSAQSVSVAKVMDSCILQQGSGAEVVDGRTVGGDEDGWVQYCSCACICLRMAVRYA